MLHHLDVGPRVLQSRELQDAVKGPPSSANAKSLTMEPRELEHDKNADGVNLPALKVVASLRNVQLSSKSFHMSRKTGEESIDAIYTSPREIILMQATLNGDHKCSGDEIFRNAEHALQYYEGDTEPKVIYALLTDDKTASLMTKRTMVSTLKNKSKKKERDQKLARVQQIVLAPDPHVFLSLLTKIRTVTSNADVDDA